MPGHWFAIYVFIITIFILGISILNAVYYNRIRNGTCNAITRKEAETGFWLNVIIAILTFILFFWSLFYFFTINRDEVLIVETSEKVISPVPIASTTPISSAPVPSFPVI